jgi:peptidyl-prolyl cis-trans isomerase D
MLEAIRNASQGLIGRAIMTVVLGVIVLSFAVWGIGDVFRGFGSDTIASVGSASIAPDEFRSAYQSAMQRYQRLMRAPLTNAQAHAMGLDVQTLARLIADTALDVETKSLGLAISDQTMAEALRNEPSLKDANGAFSRERFEEALRDMGLSERGFVIEQRKNYLRRQIAAALTAGLTAPKTLVEALARFDAESRNLDYVVLPTSAAGDIAAPSPDVLQKFYNERKAIYMAPEYRAINLLAVEPATLAKPGEVSDEDARALYEKTKDSSFGSPERRKLQQIVFGSDAEADAALAKIRSGASFEDIAKARNLTDKDIDIGDVARSAIFDKAVAEAAFALPAPGVTDVIKGQFGPVIVRVAEITPASVKPYDEVASQLKRQIAIDRAANDVLNVHDKIEDARVSGKTLGEAAQSVGLQERSVAAIDAKGLDKAGAPVENLPDKNELLSAVFASDVGADDAPLSTKDHGFVWFEVTKIEPARQLAFDEVKDRVEKEWRADQVAKALSAKAGDMVHKLDGGATLASLAAPDNLEVKSAADVRRRGTSALNPAVVAAAFNTSSSGAGSAATPEGRVVFKVTADTTPPINFDDARVKTLAAQSAGALTDDVMAEYVSALEQRLGVKIHQDALQTAEGS